MQDENDMYQGKKMSELLQDIGDSCALLSHNLKELLQQHELLLEHLAGQEASNTIRRIQSSSIATPK